MSIKKAELHVHLEGTIAPSLARKLAARNKLTIPEGLISPDGKSYLSNDFLHFLKVFDVVAALIKTPEDYYDVTFEYLKANALDDTIYMEMMYSPDHAEQSTGIESIEHLKAIQQAIDDAKEQYNIIGRIIIVAVRHFGAESAIRAAKEIAKKTVPAVTGFGLGGDEANFPPELFTKAYAIAAGDAGLSCTAHAGEFDTYEGIQKAMQYLPIKRIGHGVNAIHSPETMQMILEKDIALEICPSSNIKLGLYDKIEQHPLPLFLEAGIKVSLNSDDPPFMSTNLAREYKIVQECFNYSDDKMREITKMAIECGFVEQDVKQELLSRV